MKQKNPVFLKINIISKRLARLTKEERRLRLEMKVGTIKEYYVQLYATTLDSLNKMGKFLETQKLSKQAQEEIDNLNKVMTSRD